MPDSRPRIVFNDDGICNACINAENKKNIDWSKRKSEFKDIIESIKEQRKNNETGYDCIVPWSGGKDSTSIALKLKFEYNLNPLLVTFSPLIQNEIGRKNREELIRMGFDNYFFMPNQKIAKYLSKRFFIERGNPKVAWDAGINSVPVRLASKFKIGTIFYAEHGESEYGGLVLDEESLKKRNLREVIEHQIGDFPQNWASEDLKENELKPYIYPDEEELKKILP